MVRLCVESAQFKPLTNPPIGIGRKTVSTGWVIFFDGTRQSKCALLNEVKKVKTLYLVTLCQVDHEPEIGSDHLILSFPPRLIVLSLHRCSNTLARSLRRDGSVL